MHAHFTTNCSVVKSAIECITSGIAHHLRDFH